MKKPVLAIDLDDSLIDFQNAFLAYHNEKHGTAVTYEGIFSFTLHLVYGCAPEEMLERFREFHLHHGHGIETIPGAAEALAALRERYRLIVVTARSDVLHEVTEQLIQDRFPGCISSIHYTGHLADGGSIMPKSEVCIAEGAAALIDDGLHNAAEAARAGIPAYLFDRPWNKGPPRHGITRVRDWGEVLSHLLPAMPAR